MISRRMSDARVLTLHIGYHKTATTFLQDVVFGQHPGLIHLGRRWADHCWRHFFTQFNFADSAKFDALCWRDRFSQELDRYLNAQRALATRQSVSVSHESLHAGPDWFGVQWRVRAEMLSAAFPDARIVLGIRSQLGYIHSAYKSYVILGGRLPFARFLQLDECRQGLLMKLRYDDVLAVYWRLFGPDRVHLYLLEDLRSAPDAFLRELMGFMGVSAPSANTGVVVNRALSDGATEVIRRVNMRVANRNFALQYRNWVHQEIGLGERFRWRLVRTLKRWERRRIVASSQLLSPTQQAQIEQFYSKSNERLARMIGRDLREIGYPC